MRTGLSILFYSLAVSVSLLKVLAVEEYPCNKTASPPTKLACLICQGSSEEECRADAKYVVCSQDKPEMYACYDRLVVSSGSDRPFVHYEKGCVGNDHCNSAMWTDEGHCTISDPHFFSCERCLYGCNHGVHMCEVTCPESWKQFEGNCYYFTSHQVSWNEAKLNCEAINASMVVIDSEAEENFVVANMVSFDWIGVAQDDTDHPYTWVDGSEITYSNWASGQPNDPGLGGWEDCVAMLPDGSWDDMECALSYGFVCQKAAVSGSCEAAGWVLFGDMCYSIFEYHLSSNWRKARTKCVELGGESLIIIDSMELNNFVQSKIKGPVWLGLYQEDNDPFVTVHGSPPSYTNWPKDEPKDDDLNKDCVLLSRNGEWDNLYCRLKFNWMCEKTVR